MRLIVLLSPVKPAGLAHGWPLTLSYNPTFDLMPGLTNIWLGNAPWIFNSDNKKTFMGFYFNWNTSRDKRAVLPALTFNSEYYSLLTHVQGLLIHTADTNHQTQHYIAEYIANRAPHIPWGDSRPTFQLCVGQLRCGLCLLTYGPKHSPTSNRWRAQTPRAEETAWDSRSSKTWAEDRSPEMQTGARERECSLGEAPPLDGLGKLAGGSA